MVMRINRNILQQLYQYNGRDQTKEPINNSNQNKSLTLIQNQTIHLTRYSHSQRQRQFIFYLQPLFFQKNTFRLSPIFVFIAYRLLSFFQLILFNILALLSLKMSLYFFASPTQLPLQIIILLSLLILAHSGLLFQQSSVFGTTQVKLTTTNGFISAYSDNSFTIANPGYSNLSSIGLALCGYDIPISSSLQFRAQGSYDQQADNIVIVVLANSSTTFYFLNYFVLMATNSAASYLYIDNPCFLPTFDITNSVNYNRSYQYSVVGPFNINSSSTVVGIPFIRSLNSIANPSFNYYNITGLTYSANRATITVFANFSQVAEVCTSIIYQHRTYITANSNILFLNMSSAVNFILNSSVPSLTLASASQLYFGMNTIYGPSYSPKCVVGFNALKLSASRRQTLSFNMTGVGIYDLISSTTYQLSYSWFCIAEIKCPSTNYQYYPIINQCQPACSIANCSTCSTSTSCLVCQEGFYITVLYRCLACIANCQNCTNATSCVACYVGFYFNPSSSTCSPCSPYCTNCTISQCTSCQIGYFPSTTLCYKCSNYMSGCLRCSGSTFCDVCTEATTFRNGMCMNCSSLSLGCISCNSFICFGCGTGYFLFGNTCARCVISQSQCCSFFVPNCVTCKNQTACNICQVGFYLGQNNSCLNCSLAIPNCQTCANSTSCTSCSTGYVLDQLSCSSCSLNIPNCKSCQNVSYCLGCVSPFINVNGLCYNCTTWPMNDIYFLNANNTCVSCSEVTTNCVRCNSSTSCTLCSSLYYLYNSNCKLCSQSIEKCLSCLSGSQCSICAVGYYLNLSNTSSCLACSARIPYCLSCNSVYYNNINAWVMGCSLCMPEYFINKTICSPCIDAIPFCLTCLNSYQCKQCATYYFLSSTLTCINCQTLMPGCLSCNSSQCLNCSLGYYLVNNYCTLCSMAINYCSQCSVLNGNITCQLCVAGYYFSSRFTCVACNSTLPFCINCKNSTTCISCLPGYASSLINSTCYPCSILIPNCLYCNPILACQKCLQNYQLNSNGQCIDCNTYIDGCDKCTNVINNKTNVTSLNCTACKTGYLSYNTTNNLTKCIACNVSIFYCSTCFNLTTCKVCLNISFLNDRGTCSLCSLYLTNCIKCSNNSYCLACAPGYYPSSNFSCLPCDPTQFGIDSNQQPICNQCQQVNGVAKCTICQKGYYQNQNGCSACSDVLPFCAACDHPYSCEGCQSGYYLSDNFECVQCDSSLTYCSVCTQDGICLQCNADCYLNSALNKCTKCTDVVSGCYSCFSNGTCTKCMDGYYMQGKSCLKCSAVLPDCVFCYNSSSCALRFASDSSSPPITTMNWYIYFIIILIFIVLLIVLIVCWRKYRGDNQSKLLQRTSYTVSDTQRQLINQQKEQSETRVGQIKVQQVKICQGCNKNGVFWMNLQLLCRPCSEKQQRGNDHKIKKDFKRKVKPLSRVKSEMHQHFPSEEDGFRPQKPSEIKEEIPYSQQRSSVLRPKSSIDMFIQPLQSYNQNLQIYSKGSKNSKMHLQQVPLVKQQSQVEQIGTFKKIKQEKKSQS